MFPGVSFCLDDMPWEPLGFSLVHDGFTLQNAIDETVRGNMDKVRAQSDMGLVFDNNTVAMKDARTYDPMQPRVRFGFDGTGTETPPFQPAVPPEVLKITPESLAMVDYLERTMDKQMAINDVMALAKLRGAGSAGDMEKILEANGPIIEDMSRSMEPPMRDLGTMVKYLICQYYTTTRVMQIVGADGVAPVIFDYSPDQLIPSHGPGEDVEKPSALAPRERARIFADNLRFFITPHSLHEITQTVMKLGLIQLRKAGVKISSQTIAEAWGVPSYGHIDGSQRRLRSWKSEQEMDIEFAARMKAIGRGDWAGSAGRTRWPRQRQEESRRATTVRAGVTATEE